MAIFEQFSLIMRSQIHSLQEKMTDPERTLNQLILDMEEELETVRHSVAAAMADEITLRKRVTRSQEDTTRWLQRANKALQQGDENTAKTALAQKIRSQQQAEALAAEHQQQHTETTSLQDSVRELEGNIRQAKQKQTLLLARMARAKSQKNIRQAFQGTQNQSAFSQFARLEEKIEHAEALNSAYEALSDTPPGNTELDREFAQAEQEETLQREMEALKKQINTP